MSIEVCTSYLLYCDKCDQTIREVDYYPSSKDIARWGAKEQPSGAVWCAECVEKGEEDD